jgi:hypothetical protein
MKKNNDISPIGRALRYFFYFLEGKYNDCWAWFLKSSIKIKVATLLFIFLAVLCFITRNLDSIWYPFYKHGGTADGYFLLLNWSSNDEVVAVFFVSWVPVAIVLFLLGRNVKSEDALARSFWSLCIYPWFWNWSLGVGPIIFLLIAGYCFLVACYYKKRYLWVSMVLVIFICVSFYLLGVIICFEDIKHTKSFLFNLFF